MEEEVLLYCTDCRGQFTVPREAMVEEEMIECDLCAAEMVVVSEDPLKVRLYEPDSEF